MNTIYKIFLLFVIPIQLFAQAHEISGVWLLKVKEYDDQEPIAYQIFELNKDGSIDVQGIPFGHWKRLENQGIIEIDADKISGRYQLSCDEKRLSLNHSSKLMSLEKVPVKKSKETTTYKELIGTWQLTNTEQFIALQIAAPNRVTSVEQDEYMTSKNEGIWYYFPNDDRQIYIDLKGAIKEAVYDIIELNEDQLTLMNGKQFLYFKSLEKVQKAPKLSFTEETFYDSNGNALYLDEESKLPWSQLPIYGMQNTYAEIDYISYKYKKYIPLINNFNTKELKAHLDVNLDEDKLRISFDYIFNGFDRYHLPEDTELSPNIIDWSNPLWPYKEMMGMYRVVGQEILNTEAGVFDCTVVEGFDIFNELLVKLWLIDDLPGVIGKVIQEKPGEFGYYHSFEIENIVKRDLSNID